MKKKIISFILSSLTVISALTTTVQASTAKKVTSATLKTSELNNSMSTEDHAISMDIIGEYAIIIDADTKEVLFSKNADKKSFPASVTKLMTAIIAEENSSKSATYIYPQGPQSLPSTSVSRDFSYMPKGTEIAAVDAMKTLLMYSANDIATVIASNVPKYTDNDTSEFVALMNKKAKELGMEDTHFVTPSGLDNGTNNHLTTPYDLALLGIEALNHPWVREVITTPVTNVNLPNWATPLELTNSNKFIRKDTPYYDASAIGGKTGYTDKAGKCLLDIFNRDGKTLVAVIMKSGIPNIDSDMKTLINYGYTIEKSNLIMKDPLTGEDTEYKKGTKVATKTVKYKVFKNFGPEKEIEVPIYIDDTLTYYSNEYNDTHSKLKYNLDIDVFNTGEKNLVGTLDFNIKGNKKTVNLYTDINASYIKEISKDYYRIAYISLITASAIILFALIIVIRIRNKIRRKKRKRINQRNNRR